MWWLVGLGAAAAWYFGFWPFDGKTFNPKDTAYVAEVGYYVGTEVQYEEGSRRKTLAECRSDADSIASYRRGRNLVLRQKHNRFPHRRQRVAHAQ